MERIHVPLWPTSALHNHRVSHCHRSMRHEMCAPPYQKAAHSPCTELAHTTKTLKDTLPFSSTDEIQSFKFDHPHANPRLRSLMRLVFLLFVLGFFAVILKAGDTSFPAPSMVGMDGPRVWRDWTGHSCHSRASRSLFTSSMVRDESYGDDPSLRVDLGGCIRSMVLNASKSSSCDQRDFLKIIKGKRNMKAIKRSLERSSLTLRRLCSLMNPCIWIIFINEK